MLGYFIEFKKGMSMNKNSTVFRIIAIIVMQALLLTQVDFSLAAVCHSKESYQEAALKYQKITNKSTSLVIGAGCVQLAISGLHLPQFSLTALFSLLKGNGSAITEIVLDDNFSPFNNHICKAFIIETVGFGHNDECKGYLIGQEDTRGKIAISRTEQSTGPPMKIEKNVGCFRNRTVRNKQFGFLLSTLFKEQSELNNMREIIPPILSRAKWRDKIIDVTILLTNTTS